MVATLGETHSWQEACRAETIEMYIQNAATSPAHRGFALEDTSQKDDSHAITAENPHIVLIFPSSNADRRGGGGFRQTQRRPQRH